MTRAPALHTTDARGLDDQPAGVSPPEALPERPVDVSLVASPREVRELVDEARAEAGQERIAEVWILRRRYGDGSSVIHGVFADRLDAMRSAEEEEVRRRGGECLTAVWMSHTSRDEWALPEREDRWPARISWIVDWFPVQRAGRSS